MTTEDDYKSDRPRQENQHGSFHQRDDDSGTSITCEVCLKLFSQKSSLTRHKQTHLNDKPWTCDFKQCSKRFKLKQYLESHKRSHYKAVYENAKRFSAQNTQPLHPLLVNQPQLSQQQQQQQPLVQQHQISQQHQDPMKTLMYNEYQLSLLRANANYQDCIGQCELREQQLLCALQECSMALDRSVHMLQDCVGVMNIPLEITHTAKRYRIQYNDDK